MKHGAAGSNEELANEVVKEFSDQSPEDGGPVEIEPRRAKPRAQDLTGQLQSYMFKFASTDDCIAFSEKFTAVVPGDLSVGETENTVTGGEADGGRGYYVDIPITKLAEYYRRQATKSHSHGASNAALAADPAALAALAADPAAIAADPAARRPAALAARPAALVAGPTAKSLGRMPPRTIMSELKGFTSDHTFQCIQAGDGRCQYNGMTWNLMNQGHDKANCRGPVKYSNNPFDIQETKEDYIARKTKQCEVILQEIKNKNTENFPLDFIFLQEIDIFTSKDKDVKAIGDEFKRRLEKDHNMDIIMTKPPTPKGSGQKPLAIIYNKQKLVPDRNISAIGVFPDSKGVNMGFEVTFYDRVTRAQTVLTNVHASFGVDYRQEFLDYLYGQIKKNMMCIMGGDMNHPSNMDIIGKIGDWNVATNVDVNDAGALSLEHSQGILKNYDGFFVSPGGNNLTVYAKELMGTRFTFDRGQLSHSRFVAGNNVHQAPNKGVPWIRHKTWQTLSTQPRNATGAPIVPATVSAAPRRR